MRKDRRIARAAPASALVVLAVLGGWAPAQPPEGRLGALVPAPASSRAGAHADRLAERLAAPTAPTAPDPIPVRSAVGPPKARAVTPPVRLIVERLRADMPVVPVGVVDDGQMEIPADAALAGWYRFGAGADAATGTMVIAAHAGSHITRLGPLRKLAESETGDPVVIARPDGTALRYVVESAALVPKTTIDLSRYFRRDGEHRLILITCGGAWSEERRSYSDNAVVVARLES